MSTIKRLVCVLLCLLFAVVLFPVKASAKEVSIDGNIGNLEWNSAEKTIIFSSISESNCDIDFAFMHKIVDEKNNAVFFAFQITQKTAGALQPNNTLAGIKLKTDRGEIICHIDGTNSFDNTSYSVNQKMSIGTNNDLSIEIRVGCLLGVPVNARLQLIDSTGQSSSEHQFPVLAPPSTTQATGKPATTKPDTTKLATTTKPVTTKPVTTKPATTSPTTTGVQRTTQAGQKTTVAPTSGSFIIKTSNAASTEDMLGEEVTADEAAGEQSNSDKTDDTSQGEVFTEYVSSEKDNSGTKKQVAAVAVAVILLSLAGYFLFLASKQKAQPKPEPEKPPEDADEIDFDDDF